MEVVVKKSELKEIIQLLSGLDYGLMIEPIKDNYVIATFRAEEDMDVVREIILDYKHGLISKLIGEDIYIRDDISDAYFTFYEDDTYHVAGILVATIESALRSEEHTSELQSRGHLVCRLLLEQKTIE